MAFASRFVIHVWAARSPSMALPILGVRIIWANLRRAWDLGAEIHVLALNATELRWFGLEGSVGRQSLHESSWIHDDTAFDLLCGLGNHVSLVESFLSAVLVCSRNPDTSFGSPRAFLLIDVRGLATSFVYLAAPPRDVTNDGPGPAVLDARPGSVVTVRFDALVDVTVFRERVPPKRQAFGGMPSLRCMDPKGWSWRPGFGQERAPTGGCFAVGTILSLLGCVASSYSWSQACWPVTTPPHGVPVADAPGAEDRRPVVTQAPPKVWTAPSSTLDPAVPFRRAVWSPPTAWTAAIGCSTHVRT